MKKLLTRIGMVLVMLLILNWVYSTWFFEKDLRKHSDIVVHAWDVVNDSCRIVYLGESSNNTYGEKEANHRKISEFTSDYFPTVKMGDMTKSAGHAQTYYYMLKHVPASSTVETVVVTMNLRSFGPIWIYSRLETALRKQLVLLEDYPPLMNRFLLAFKAYTIRTDEEWDALAYEHRHKDRLDFPYEFEFDDNYAWDSANAWRGWFDFDGKYNNEMTWMAGYYIKSYGFSIFDDNPRVKDFDAIVELCRERGWNLVFNILAEDVDKAMELGGKDLIVLMKQNRDYLLRRYGGLDGVTVVDNLSLVRDVNFIDQEWTTEHYYEEGRRIIADHLAQTLRNFYPEDYHNPDSLKMDTGHYFLEGTITIDRQTPYSMALALTADSIRSDWGMVNVAFEINQEDSLNRVVFAVEKLDAQGEKTIDSYDVKAQVRKMGEWDFAVFTLPINSTFRSAQKIKLYIHNFSEHAVQIRGFDVSFRPAYLKAKVKAQSSKSGDGDNGK